MPGWKYTLATVGIAATLLLSGCSGGSRQTQPPPTKYTGRIYLTSLTMPSGLATLGCDIESGKTTYYGFGKTEDGSQLVVIANDRQTILDQLNSRLPGAEENPLRQSYFPPECR